METIAATSYSARLEYPTSTCDKFSGEQNFNLAPHTLGKYFSNFSVLRYACVCSFIMFFSWNVSYAQCGYNYHAHQARNAQLQKKAEKKMKRAKGDLVNFSCVSETKSKSAMRAKKRLSRHSRK